MSMTDRWFDALADDKAGPDAWLQAFGNITQPVDDDADALLTFAPLDRCATPADVDSLTAIFSLAGSSECRQIKLPTVPMKGRWTTLTRYPFDQQFFDPIKTTSGTTREYQQTCWVWQAEEINVNRSWQRFNGVVGPHEIARVPAAEIEFPSE